MSTIRIDWTGPATSVQDMGRFGAQRYGLGTAGAMDRLSLARANALVGQEAGMAAIEIGPLPLKLTVTEGPVRFALAGGERTVTLYSGNAQANASFRAETGEVIAISAARTGVFSYLAIEGGIIGKPVFGSLSVLHRAMIGSPLPRPLAAHDSLEVAAASSGDERCSCHPPFWTYHPSGSSKGHRTTILMRQPWSYWSASDWKISPTSDRMGYRLEGPVLSHAKGFNIISDGIANGHIQIPGNGQPLVLLADRGTTGGYPKAAAIITADLGRFAQIPTGTPFRFAYVSIEDGQELYRSFMRQIESLREAPMPVSTGVKTEILLTSNVAGQAVNAHDPVSWAV